MTLNSILGIIFCLACYAGPVHALAAADPDDIFRFFAEEAQIVSASRLPAVCLLTFLETSA